MSLFILKLKISLKSIISVLIRWPYLLIAIFASLLAEAMVLWSLNIDLVKYILFDSGVSIATKFDFFFSVYRDIFINYESVQALAIITFSFLFGINTALVIFVLRNQDYKSIPKKSGFGGLILAIIGGGCLACGTSILYPILITLGVGTTAIASELGLILSAIGSVLLLFSIYKLGGVVSFVIKSREQ